ncbi:MAG TPA: hypothetical protein VNT75_09140 [Symbiobacteriaceae bacterium]|nr:hypothetical protein [Symbiobacteriaceae bacterium]
MVPNKVIHIREARRRLVQAKKRRSGPKKSPLAMRISAWLTSGTTKGTALMTGLVAGLLTGAVVLSVLSAGQTPLPPQVAPVETVGTANP